MQEEIPSWISSLYNYAWFVGFILSGIIYGMLMKREIPAVRAIPLQEEIYHVNTS